MKNYYLRAPKVVGVSGFRLEGSPELLALLRRLDEEAPKRSALIELGDPTWSPEVVHQRWFAGSMWHNSPDEIINAAKRGRPVRLYIVLPQKWFRTEEHVPFLQATSICTGAMSSIDARHLKSVFSIKSK